MPTIILEGMDNSGKSMLADYLKDQLHIPVIHSDGPFEDWQVPLKIFWCQLALFHHHPLICDRIPFISEEVYGKGLRGKNLFEKSLGRDCYQFMLKSFLDYKPLIIFCRPPKDILCSRLDDGSRTHLKGVIERKEFLIELYDIFMEELKRLGFNITWYDYTLVGSKPRILTIVTSYLSHFNFYFCDNR